MTYWIAYGLNNGERNPTFCSIGDEGAAQRLAENPHVMVFMAELSVQN